MKPLTSNQTLPTPEPLAVLQAQQNADAQDALEAALHANRNLKDAERALLAARAAYNAACANLAPFRSAARRVAA